MGGGSRRRTTSKLQALCCVILLLNKTVNCEFRYLAGSCFTLKKTLFTLASDHNTSTL